MRHIESVDLFRQIINHNCNIWKWSRSTFKFEKYLLLTVNSKQHQMHELKYTFLFFHSNCPNDAMELSICFGRCFSYTYFLFLLHKPTRKNCFFFCACVFCLYNNIPLINGHWFLLNGIIRNFFFGVDDCYVRCKNLAFFLLWCESKLLIEEGKSSEKRKNDKSGNWENTCDYCDFSLFFSQ